MSIESRLGLNVFKVDKNKHIKPDFDECKICKNRLCLFVCPAHLYTEDKEGNVVFDHEGCLECGTCRLTCSHISWSFPRCGYGIQYRFG